MNHWTEEDYAAYQARQKQHKPKPSRYRNEPVTVDGEKFASKKQYARWCQLKMLEKAGKIANLEREVPFELAPGVTLSGKRKPSVRYYADAVYEEDGAKVVEDTKSDITRRDPVYRIKKHLMMSVHGIEIMET